MSDNFIDNNHNFFLLFLLWTVALSVGKFLRMNMFVHPQD